jgi:hypothetical protein
MTDFDSPGNISSTNNISGGKLGSNSSKIPRLNSTGTAAQPVLQQIHVDCTTTGDCCEDAVQHQNISNATTTTTSSKQYQGSSSNVKVIVRVRPHPRLVPGSQDVIGLTSGDGSVHVELKDPGRETYVVGVDHALGQESTQQDVFDVVGWPMVDHCMDGFHSTIFAYGQTGSGKTHTMMGEIDDGDAGHVSENAGLIPRVFDALFSVISEKESEEYRCTVRCSFLEIYNEEITDLLDPSLTGLQIRDGDSSAGVYVQGLSERQVFNVNDVLELIQAGSKNRSIGATRMNDRSSRSHSVFTATIESRRCLADGSVVVKHSKLNLIDLAGSERVGRSGATGEQLVEARSINKSLTVLGRVISSLVEKQEKKRKGIHVPYRDSKLTFLLQESLGGNSKTAMVATVTPTADSAAETYCTLAFAAGAKKIKCTAVVNEDKEGDLKSLLAENERLRAALEHGGDGQKVRALEMELEQTKMLFDQNSSVITVLRAEQSIIQRELVESKATALRATQEASTLRASNVSLSNAFESLEEDNAQLHRALNNLQDRFVHENGELEHAKAAMVEEMEQVRKKAQEELDTLRKEMEVMKRNHDDEKDVLLKKIEDMELVVKESETRVEESTKECSALLDKIDVLETSSRQLEQDIVKWKSSAESFRFNAKVLEDEICQSKKMQEKLSLDVEELAQQKVTMQNDMETAAKAAKEREETLLAEIQEYKNQLEEYQNENCQLKEDIVLEQKSVSKYKRMVGEIGRLVDWAQASAPGSAAAAAALAVARNGSKPSPAAQAALRVARMSLASGSSRMSPPILSDATNIVAKE